MPALVRSLATAAAAAALLSGCGLIGDGPTEAPRASDQPDAVAAGAGPSRDRVQQYLDAMRTKDVRKGRSQLCPVLYSTFDQAASGPNGDFARHFRVTAARIVDVRVRGGKHEVVASVTVTAGERRMVRSVAFTVALGESGWCIDGEVPVAAPAARPSGSMPASPVP